MQAIVSHSEHDTVYVKDLACRSFSYATLRLMCDIILENMPAGESLLRPALEISKHELIWCSALPPALLPASCVQHAAGNACFHAPPSWLTKACFTAQSLISRHATKPAKGPIESAVPQGCHAVPRARDETEQGRIAPQTCCVQIERRSR